MKSKGIEAMRASGSRVHYGAEAHVDYFRVRLKVWSHRMDEFVMLTTAEARALALQLIGAADRVESMEVTDTAGHT